MKIKIIQNKISRRDILSQGVILFKQALESIGYKVDIEMTDSTRNFTAQESTGTAVGTAVGINPSEILQEAGPGYKLAILIYSEPRGTNPMQYNWNLNGMTPISIPESWYNIYPEVLCDYLLHETAHAGFFFKDGYLSDTTHLMNNRNLNPFEYDKWIILGTKAYYLHLLTDLKPYLDPAVTGTAPINTVVPTTGTSNPTLKQGSKGSAVKELQAILGITADGIFGPITRKVVIAFQLSRNLVADGIVGPNTWAELKKNP